MDKRASGADWDRCGEEVKTSTAASGVNGLRKLQQKEN